MAAESERSSRAIYARTLLAIGLVGLAAVLIFRILTIAFDASAETILGRVTEARAALPTIVAEDEDLAMVFGSSMVDAGFSPRQFDRELEERGVDLKSFNFGFGGLNPYFQDFWARRIRESFEQADRRLELAVIEFNPFQTTQARWNGALPAVDSFLVMLASPSEMWEILLEDPTRGIRLFTIRYLRNDISAEMTTSFFGRPLRPSRPRSTLPRDEEAEARLRELGEELGRRLDEDYPEYPDANWYYPWQGSGTLPEERSEETQQVYHDYYEVLRGERYLDDDKLNRLHCCDVEGLHFEPVLVEAFIRVVETFQQFSERVEVIMLPRNTDWIEYSPEARARLEEAIARIESGTGIPIRDFQDLDEITPEMFSDTTHLARYSGNVAFTSFLAERYAPMLGGSSEPIDQEGVATEEPAAAGETSGG